MARPNTWMPVYWPDYWADTGHLSAAEHGAYLNLLGRYWRDRGLPNVDVTLQRLSTMTEREWRASRQTIRAFFGVSEDGLRLTHKRADDELATATAKYDAKAKAGAKGAEKRWQSDSTSIAQPSQSDSRPHSKSMSNGCTTHNSHSPNGEKHPSDVLVTSPKRRSQIPADWKPNEKDFDHATARNLDPNTIRNLVEPFRDHHTAKQTLSANWSANWRTWVGNHINFHGTGPWPRPDAGRSKPNAGTRQSVVSARDSILAKAGIPREGGDRTVRDDGAGWANGDCTSQGNIGPVIDADEWQRVPGSADGTEGDDATNAGHDGRRGGAANGVSQTADAVPGGRSAEGFDDPSRSKPVVACMVGTEGTARGPHVQAADDAICPASLRGAA